LLFVPTVGEAFAMAELKGVHVLVAEDTDDPRDLRPMPSEAEHGSGRRPILSKSPQSPIRRHEPLAGVVPRDARWTSPFLPVTTFAC
jgi:hypothetical protein